MAKRLIQICLERHAVNSFLSKIKANYFQTGTSKHSRVCTLQSHGDQMELTTKWSRNVVKVTTLWSLAAGLGVIIKLSGAAGGRGGHNE